MRAVSCLSSESRRLLKTVCIILTLVVTTAVVARAQTYTKLYDFTGLNGEMPEAMPVQASDGNFYGTTQLGGGGIGALGSIFKMSSSGTVTAPYYSFCSRFSGGLCQDGQQPFGAPMQATDGNFYGTTAVGGASANCIGGCGTVFKMTLNGSLTTIYSFCSTNGCHDGATPGSTLIQATDGNIYGMTLIGGASGNGTLFKITPSGALTTLYNFCSQSNCADGSEPYAGLIQATDGNFYGMTTAGGTGAGAPCQNLTSAPGCGTIFKLTPNGTLTTLHNFCSETNCTDGSTPYGAFVQGTDGNLYGTTLFGGAGTVGLVFRISTSGGDYTVLHSFIVTDGAEPLGSLIQGTDGNFYGTTSAGNNIATNAGTIFKMTPGGTVSTLHNFTGADGANPRGRLVQATNGTIYGTTYYGGSASIGVVFSLSGPAPTATQFVPVTPCRLVDTRQTQTPIQAGTWETFTVPQLGGCNIPGNALAYSLNVTVIPQGHLGYLTIWPAGGTQPAVSTMNSPDGRVKANAAIVPSGASGAVNVFASNTTNVLLDINGYFAAPGGNTYQFYPLTPCRIIDTRNGQNGGSLQAGVERDYLIAGKCGVPTTATAYSLNVTVLPTQGSLDYLTVWPQGESQPIVSTLNDNTGTNVANAAIVPAGSNNTTAFYAHNHNTDLLLDVNGYFAPPGQGGYSMYPVAPCRVLDTRQSGGAFSGEKTVNVVGSPCAPPANAKAYVFNATAVPPGSMPFLTLWPDGQQQPQVSTLNARDGFITSNMAIVPTQNGSIDAYAAALTQLIVDISGYFAP